MALCESQLDSALPLKRELDDSHSSQESPDKKTNMETNGDVYGIDPAVASGLPLSVDYRSPVSHFVPPAVELYAARQKTETVTSTPESSGTPTPIKRKRGRPRIDKTSPEYLANLAARKQAREMAAMMSRDAGTPQGEKRKRGRPRIDKTSPEYLARKRARELEALERKAIKEYRRRTTGGKPVHNNKPTKKIPMPTTAATRNGGKRQPNPVAGKKLPVNPSNGKKIPVSASGSKKPIGIRKIAMKGARTRQTVNDRKIIMRRNPKFIKKKDSAASSSAGEGTPRVKRKYTKRTPSAKKTDAQGAEKAKGKRGRPRKVDQLAAGKQPQQPKIRVRSNLMPMSSETITLDSDDEPDLGSPSQASDSLSLDENLRALRHIHEKYANIDKDELYDSHLLGAKFQSGVAKRDDEVLSIRSDDGNASVKEVGNNVEKLEDSSNSDSDSSSSDSDSSSSGSSSSSSSSSDSSDSSDSETDQDMNKGNAELQQQQQQNNSNHEDDSRSFGAWSYSAAASNTDTDSDPDPERTNPALQAGAVPGVPVSAHSDISESENESADKSFQCHICRKWYSTRVTLKIHRRSHQRRGGAGGGGGGRSRARSSDRYECDCCSDTFNRREKLLEHKAVVHRGAMTVRCDVCRRCFEDDSELATHTDTHTQDERDGRCTECGTQFGRYEQLRRHRAAAHGVHALPAPGSGSSSRMPHACTQCGKRFTHAHSLTRHMHNHAKQLYRCVVCKASFARADQLAQHLNSHLANYKRLKP